MILFRIKKTGLFKLAACRGEERGCAKMRLKPTLPCPKCIPCDDPNETLESVQARVAAMSERHECSETGCTHDGDFAPKLCVPHKGADEDPNPFTSILGIRLCRKHVEEFTPQRLLEPGVDPNLRTVLEGSPMLTRGPLEFDLAYIVPIATTDPAYQAFLNMRRPPAS